MFLVSSFRFQVVYCVLLFVCLRFFINIPSFATRYNSQRCGFINSEPFNPKILYGDFQPIVNVKKTKKF